MYEIISHSLLREVNNITFIMLFSLIEWMECGVKLTIYNGQLYKKLTRKKGKENAKKNFSNRSRADNGNDYDTCNCHGRNADTNSRS